MSIPCQSPDFHTSLVQALPPSGTKMIRDGYRNQSIHRPVLRGNSFGPRRPLYFRWGHFNSFHWIPPPNHTFNPTDVINNTR